MAVTYEAGPTGFGLARAFAGVGVRCVVVAPSKLERPPGDRWVDGTAAGRDLRGLKDLADEGITTLQVDVTDEESMVAAVERITEDHGAVGVLVNNAAYSLNGTIGETPMEQVRRRFPHTLSLVWAPTEGAASPGRVPVAGRGDLDVTLDFVRHLRGADASDAERLLLQEAVESCCGVPDADTAVSAG